MEGPRNYLRRANGTENPGSRVLTRDDEAIILAYRWRTRLPLNVCHDRLRRLMPKLSRSALYRCLKRWELSKIGWTAPGPWLTKSALAGPFTFEITANEIVFRYEASGASVPVFLAVEEVTKQVYAEAIEGTPKNAAAFLARWVAAFPQRIHAVTTDVTQPFTDWPGMYGEDMAPVSPHPFAVVCRANKIVHHPNDSAVSKTPYAATSPNRRRNPIAAGVGPASRQPAANICP